MFVKSCLKERLMLFVLTRWLLVTKKLNTLRETEGFSLYKIDASDYESLAKVFEDNDIECVYHLAANSDIQFSATKPEVEYQNTYSTTFQVLQCMKRYGVSKLFFLRHLQFMEIRETRF